MDIYGLLTDDHRLVEDLIDQIEEGTSLDTDLFERMRNELLIHSQAEDETFYNALARTTEGAALIEESRQDHSAVEGMLEEIGQGLAPEDDWRQKIDDLEQLVADHVAFEEDEVIPLAQRLLDEDEAQRLGERFTARKEELMATRHQTHER